LLKERRKKKAETKRGWLEKREQKKKSSQTKYFLSFTYLKRRRHFASASHMLKLTKSIDYSNHNINCCFISLYTTYLLYNLPHFLSP
jgi:hypothetical protein